MAVKYTHSGREFMGRAESALAGRLAKAVKVVAAAARQKAPVRTGQLRDSIHEEIGADPLQASVVADAPYALYVEAGTRLAPAHPFLRPAVAETRAEVERIMNGE